MPARGNGHNTASPVRRAQAKNDAAQLRSETEKRRQREERLNLAKAHREERRRLEEEWKRKLEALDEYCRAKIRVLAEARSPLRATIHQPRCRELLAARWHAGARGRALRSREGAADRSPARQPIQAVEPVAKAEGGQATAGADAPIQRGGT